MVTPEDIAVELGRTAPDPNTAQHKQWMAWIARAYRAIQRRAERLGVDYNSIDPDDVDEVVTYIVKRLALAPSDGAEQVSEQVAVDDGNMQQSRHYRAGYGDAWVLDEWWSILGLTEPDLAENWSGSAPYSRGS